MKIYFVEKTSDIIKCLKNPYCSTAVVVVLVNDWIYKLIENFYEWCFFLWYIQYVHCKQY